MSTVPGCELSIAAGDDDVATMPPLAGDEVAAAGDDVIDDVAAPSRDTRDPVSGREGPNAFESFGGSGGAADGCVCV